MSHLKRGTRHQHTLKVISSYPSPLLFPLGLCRWTVGWQWDNQSLGTRKRERVGGNRDPKWVWRSEEKKSRQRIAFSIHLSAANTSLQTQTYTPVIECKYLDMGKVGCYLSPPLKEVLFRWTWSNEYTRRSSECFDTMHENLILMTPMLLFSAQWSAGLTAILLLSLNAHQTSTTARNHWICAEKNIPPVCCILLLLFLNHFQITICALGPYTLWAPIWSRKPNTDWIEYHRTLKLMGNTDDVGLTH